MLFKTSLPQLFDFTEEEKHSFLSLCILAGFTFYIAYWNIKQQQKQEHFSKLIRQYNLIQSKLQKLAYLSTVLFVLKETVHSRVNVGWQFAPITPLQLADIMWNRMIGQQILIIRALQLFYVKMLKGLTRELVFFLKNYPNNLQNSLLLGDHRKSLQILSKNYTQIRAILEKAKVAIRNQQKALYQTDVRILGQGSFQWELITIGEQQYSALRVLTQMQFQKQIKDKISITSFQVVRSPFKMRCCKQIPNKEQKWDEQINLKKQIVNRGRCLLCQSIITIYPLEFDRKAFQEIKSIRKRLQKTYNVCAPPKREQWMKLIDSYFGGGYTEKHIIRKSVRTKVQENCE